jgi:histidyl-tRNA synthetase
LQLDNTRHTVLPMQIEGLFKYIDDDLKNRFRELIKLKATVGEKYMHKADADLFEWIKTMFEKLALAKDNIKVNNVGMDSLNEFFIKMFYAKANN